MPTLLTFAGSIPFISILQSEAPMSGSDVFCFVFGFLAVCLEHFADRTLAENDRIICNMGVWSVVPHPNYLGEILFWWSLSCSVCRVKSTVGRILGGAC
jgi:steroid 5-alpha reductase family enzyme